ncbi:MAG TPA: pyridoxamine 5'-phosphate oxidase family protein [Asticcacaulis sp.]|nr:pyridoxamine 5'-phosphate oxidase family protein [Asticcacaulis sp.]
MTIFHDFLKSHRLGVVSTTGPDGPQAALVGIAVTADLKLIFDTVESTRKFANLMRNPACAVVAGWEGEQTLQYEGTAERVGSHADNPVLAPYFAAWPDGIERLGWAGIAHFVITPKWLRFSDFGQTPPRIETWRP